MPCFFISQTFLQKTVFLLGVKYRKLYICIGNNANNIKTNIMSKLTSITAIANEKELTYVITKTYSDGSEDNYKTNEMSSAEFEEADYNTESDWKDFLNTSGDYYVI